MCRNNFQLSLSFKSPSITPYSAEINKNSSASDIFLYLTGIQSRCFSQFNKKSALRFRIFKAVRFYAFEVTYPFSNYSQACLTDIHSEVYLNRVNHSLEYLQAT